MRVTHRLPRRRLSPLLLGLFVAPALAGCELIADFDSEEAEGRTVPVTPLPTLDGAVALMPDGSVRDAALVSDPVDDDAGATDAAVVVVPPVDAGD